MYKNIECSPSKEMLLQDRLMMIMFVSCHGAPDDILCVDQVRKKDYDLSSLTGVLLKRGMLRHV